MPDDSMSSIDRQAFSAEKVITGQRDRKCATMRWKFSLLAAFAACLAPVPLNGTALAQGAYIGQMDMPAARSGGRMPSRDAGGGAGVYIDQLPPSARPRPAPSPRRKGTRQKAVHTAQLPARRTLPDVGAGVTLAVPASVQDGPFPSVGKGTVGS